MDNEYKNYLIEYFKEDVQKLSKLLNIDLKKLWLE